MFLLFLLACSDAPMAALVAQTEDYSELENTFEATIPPVSTICDTCDFSITWDAAHQPWLLHIHGLDVTTEQMLDGHQLGQAGNGVICQQQLEYLDVDSGLSATWTDHHLVDQAFFDDCKAQGAITILVNVVGHDSSISGWLYSFEVGGDTSLVVSNP